jgi:CheY-like chemotaxis protein
MRSNAGAKVELNEKTILLIEDNKIVREMLHEYLKDYFNTFVASDGEEGINLYEKHKDKIDFIITDIMMPGICGDGVVEYVREKNKNIPILCITGACEEDTMKKIMSYENVKIIGKPFTTSGLHSEIQTMMNKEN